MMEGVREGLNPLPITQPHQVWSQTAPKEERGIPSLCVGRLVKNAEGQGTKLKVGEDGPEDSPGLP